MAKSNSGSRADGAIGCGIFAAVIQANILHFVIIGMVLGAILGLFAEPEAGNNSHKEKSKQHKQSKNKRKAREGTLVSRNYTPPKSIERRRDFSRLEVPGGYVPLEVTKTETKTKDTVTTETKIKTYIDSKEVKAVLKGQDIDLLSDGK